MATAGVRVCRALQPVVRLWGMQLAPFANRLKQRMVAWRRPTYALNPEELVPAAPAASPAIVTKTHVKTP
jgi:hypothetical protein